MVVLEVKDVSRNDARGFRLDNINIQLKTSERLAIVGETGSGKSTLLKIIAGITNPDDGMVVFEGERVKRVPEEKLIPGHPGISYLSQYFELPKHLRIHQVLEYANELQEEDASQLFALCRIGHLLERRTDELSGGEQQRVALARLLIGAPHLLLLDEPFTNLDMSLKATLRQVLHDISSRLAITTVLVSHDPGDTLSWATRFIVLRDGRIVQEGDAYSVYYQPADEYVAGLFGTYNLLDDAQLEMLSPSDKRPGARLFIRPSQIGISHNPASGARATILSSQFFGNYYELRLLMNDARLVARSTSSGHRAGDEVFVFLEKRTPWHL